MIREIRERQHASYGQLEDDVDYLLDRFDKMCETLEKYRLKDKAPLFCEYCGGICGVEGLDEEHRD